MTKYCITFRSVTFAQKGQRILSRAGLDTQLRRTPKGMSHRGCSYCLQLKTGEATARASELLRQQGAVFEGIYRTDDRGEVSQWSL